MKKKVYLGDFSVVKPLYTSSQLDGVEWLAAAHARSEQSMRPELDVASFVALMKKLVSRYGCSPERIARRSHEWHDFTHTDWQQMSIYRLHEHPAGVGMGKRMELFSGALRRVFAELYGCSRFCDKPPEHLIHVTCTGYVSPSAPQEYVAKAGWSTKVTHVYHMGCYAAVPALRVARGFLAAEESPQACAHVVHTELCTLHLNPAMHSPEQLVVQSLFADGFIGYRVSKTPCASHGFEILAVDELLIPDSTDAMTWVLNDWGMAMTLSRNVPQYIADHISSFVEQLFIKSQLKREQFPDSKVLYAIHPGGPKIIDSLATLLRLQEEQIAHCRHILFERGNMSSATLPHVWASIATDNGVPPGTVIVSLAFGPGLTIAGALLRKG